MTALFGDHHPTTTEENLTMTDRNTPARAHRDTARHIASTLACAVVVYAAARHHDAAGLAGWLLVADVTVALAITAWLGWPFYLRQLEANR